MSDLMEAGVFAAARYGQNITGFCDDVPNLSVSRQELLVSEPAFLRNVVAGFAIFAVIDECADGNFCSELWSAADVVIVVIVGDENVIDFVDSGIVSGGDDTVGVADNCYPGQPVSMRRDWSVGRRIRRGLAGR